MDYIKEVLKGTTGIASIELVNIIPTEPESIETILKLFLQVAVGLVTIWGILRKKKE